MPRDKIHAGIVMKDFDYSLPPPRSTYAFSRLMIPLLEAVIKQRVHLSMGARGAESTTHPGPELLCLVGGFPGLD